ncbi:MAG: type II toxin-antitoxin system VapC family toxin [Kineosporiaceae bacterium]
MTTGTGGQWACDTSVAVPALDPTHEAHDRCRPIVLETRPALAGHAAFEAHSVLTRLPVPLRLSPELAAEVLARAFPDTCWLSPEEGEALRCELGEHRVIGGAVYDALVGRAADSAGRTLLTRDRRARATYESLGIEYRFVD